MNGQRRLILHADDFGMSRVVTDGIVQGFTRGALTSTSILANAPGFEHAIEAWKQLRPKAGAKPFDLGVHLNLTQGRPLLGRAFPAALLDRAGRFPGIGGLFARLPVCTNSWRRSIRDELAAQIERTLAQGVTITHLNGHQYVELLPVVREIVFELATAYRIQVIRRAREAGLDSAPKCGLKDRVLGQLKRRYAIAFAARLAETRLVAPDQFFGSVHAGRIDAQVVKYFLMTASQTENEDSNYVEVALHPGLPTNTGEGANVEDGWKDPLARWRPVELNLLTDPSLLSLVASAGFAIGRLSDLKTARGQRLAA